MDYIKYYFLFFVLGFVGGIWGMWIDLFSFDVFKIGVVVLCGISLFLSLSFYIKKRTSFILVLLCLFLWGICLGGIRLSINNIAWNDFDAEDILNRDVLLEAKVKDSTDAGLILKIVSIDNVLFSTTKLVLIKDSPFEFGYNDTVLFRGVLKKPHNQVEDQNSKKHFDYELFLRQKGIGFVLENSFFLKKHESNTFTLRSILYSLREWWEERLLKFIDPKEASLALGMTVAGKGALPSDLKNDFIRAGLIHIVVLSGYNIAIIVRAFMRLFSFCSRRLRGILAFSGIVLFVLMVGGGMPVLRSAIMASITLLGFVSFTRISQNRALLGAVFCMALWNPLVVLNDASFILSVIATFAIINFSEYAKKIFVRIPEKMGLRQIIAETIAVEVCVLPYILYQIGSLSLIAPLTNFVVLPFVPLIMFLTFAVVLLSLVPFVAFPFALMLSFIIKIVIGFVHYASLIPFAFFEIKSFPFALMCLCYFGIFYLLLQEKCVSLQKIHKGI